VGAQVVEHHVELQVEVWMRRQHLVHEAEKLAPSAAGRMTRLDQPRGPAPASLGVTPPRTST
jgi:hypothetical protein